MRRPSALAAVLFIAGLLAGCGGESRKTDDASANEAILSELPSYPPAKVDDKTVNPYYPEDGAGAAPLGHTTNVNYEVPKGTGQVVLARFYSSRLMPEWRCRTERIPTYAVTPAAPGTSSNQTSSRPLPGQSLLLLHCSRGRAILSLNPDNLSST